jgi:hypothetical protein
MYKLLCDVSNPGFLLSKEHGHNIPRETTLEIPEEFAERLIQIGAAVKMKGGVDLGSPEGNQTVITDPATTDEIPDDLEQLKALADKHGIQYAANIGAATLKERIEKAIFGE